MSQIVPIISHALACLSGPSMDLFPHPITQGFMIFLLALEVYQYVRDDNREWTNNSPNDLAR